MASHLVPQELSGFPVYFVGIKGTGMAALAELFSTRGAHVSGSDTHEKFYTDEVLGNLGIPYREGFDAANIPANTGLVIHSAAYDPQSHPELLEAEQRGIPVLEYTKALGELSRTAYSLGIAGVHGKTTTTAMIGTVCREAELPVYVLVGSAVSNFGNRSTYVGGNRFFIAETCEYRRHFLHFSPDVLVVTTVDADHLDYYRDAEDVKSAFVEFGLLLPEGGSLIYCADDPGASEVAGELVSHRGDIRMIPYGFSADGPYRIHDYKMEPGVHRFRLGTDEKESHGLKKNEPGAAPVEEPFTVCIPGRHSVLNATAAAAVVRLLGERLVEEGETERQPSAAEREKRIRKGLATFSGSKRRSEILGEHGGIIFADDYGHHPRELRSTIEGFRDFYPDRRLIVDFMSHTYSRTEAFLSEFGEAFSAADEVILHKIYASAREAEGIVDGGTLFEEVKKHHNRVRYFHEVMDAEPYLIEHLRRGDLFLSMGAGDNWRISRAMKNRAEHGEVPGGEPK